MQVLSKCTGQRLALVLPTLTAEGLQAQRSRAEKPLKAIALVTVAGAQNTSSGPSDGPRGQDCSHPADLGDQPRPGVRGATGAIMVGTSDQTPPKSRTTSLSLKMYQLRLVGHAEISTEQYQLVCQLARPARCGYIGSHRWTRHSRHVRASDCIIAAHLGLAFDEPPVDR